MSLYSTLAFSLFALASASLAPKDLDAEQCIDVIGPVSELHISDGVAAPDGFEEPVVWFNGQFNAPLIQAKKGDEFRIKVFNELTNQELYVETSVHFHGIFQNHSDWADGAAGVTQCPLRQGEEFVQRFSTTQTGTYWYHAHTPAQYCHGLRGPLVIYDDDDPLADLYDIDDENTVVTLADWYHDPAAPVEKFELPNATLINGRGRYAGGPPVPLSVVNVEQGYRYRFRVIAMSCEAAFNFTIDGHRMTVIEADGNEVSPVDVDSLQIFTGQRYSVVVTADQPIGNYWIRASTNLPNSTFEGGQNLAILRYDGAADEDPTSAPGPYEISLDERDLHPLFDLAAPGTPEIGQADVNLALQPGFDPVSGNFSLNGVTYVPPTVPVLLQILSGARDASQLLPKGSVYVLPPNKVIEISFPQPDRAVGAPHPMHLHGNAFQVIRSAGGNSTNFVDPVRRDVVSIGSNSSDNTTIRFVTDNHGPWVLHCHLEAHFSHGFAVVLVAGPNETAVEESPLVPEDWKDLCKY